jgi:hypothetical protein
MKKVLSSPSLLFLWIILLSLSIAPAIFLGDDNRNLFLIVVMSLSPILLILHFKLYRSEVFLLLFMLSIIIIPSIAHPESMRWSTVLYSLMFSVTFLTYNRLLHKNIFTIESYLIFLKYIIYGYTITLLIQQFCVLTGLPILNVHNYYTATPWKLNSLSAEPSHSARIVALLMYCYIIIKEIIENKKYDFKENIKTDKWIWFSFVWTMLTMGSGTAILFLGIVFLKFVRLRTLFPLSILIIISIVLINVVGIHSYERVFNVIIATLTFDTDAIMKADDSASTRIVPMMIIAQMANFISFDGWFGHGIDSTNAVIRTIPLAFPDNATGGAMLQIWWEYGFLTFILFVGFSLKMTFRRKDILTFVFWFFLVFMYGVNNQIVWLTIVLLYTNIFFYDKGKYLNNKESNVF